MSPPRVWAAIVLMRVLWVIPGLRLAAVANMERTGDVENQQIGDEVNEVTNEPAGRASDLEAVCFMCGRPAAEVKKLIVGTQGCICITCVRDCWSIVLADEENTE